MARYETVTNAACCKLMPESESARPMVTTRRPTPVLFCADPLDARRPDAVYAAEAAAAQAAGFDPLLISYEALVDEGNPRGALRQVAARPERTLGLYRGWMLRPADYGHLYMGLAERNILLINDPLAYQHAHYLPESFDLIKAHTPFSVWLTAGPDVALDEVMAVLRPFGDQAVIVKDFVKSQKHQWAEACYIPSASDRDTVDRVVRRFLDLRGPDLNEGLVFRAFVDLAPLATHSRSGMPLAQEYRIFVLDGTPVYVVDYWDEGGYGGGAPPVDLFQGVTSTVRSCFFTMDVARQPDGEWIILELGDGQVAGLPERGNPDAFYAALHERWPSMERAE